MIGLVLTSRVLNDLKESLMPLTSCFNEGRGSCGKDEQKPEGSPQNVRPKPHVSLVSVGALSVKMREAIYFLRSRSRSAVNNRAGHIERHIGFGSQRTNPRCRWKTSAATARGNKRSRATVRETTQQSSFLFFPSCHSDAETHTIR